MRSGGIRVLVLCLAVAPAVGASVDLLRPGAALERRLAGGETHGYDVALHQGELLRVSVGQEDLDVVVLLRDPAGRELLRADAMTGLSAPEEVSLVAGEDGIYRLEIRSLFSGSSPHLYKVSAEPVRQATDEDRLRAGQEREVSAAEGLVKQPTAEGLARALEVYQQALARSPSSPGAPDRAGMLYRIGQVHLLRGDGGAGLEAFGKALALYREAGNPRGVAATLNQTGRCQRLLGKPDAAAAAFDESIALWQSLGMPGQAASVLNNLGRLQHGLGRLREAREAYAEALESFRREGDRGRESAALLNLSAVDDSLGQPVAAEEQAQQALAIARELGDRSREAESLNALGTLQSGLGEPIAALDSYTAALKIFQELGDGRREAAILNNLGNLLIELGSPEEARGLLLTGLERARQVKDRQFEGAALLNLGLAALNLGRSPEGREHYAQALALHRSLGDRNSEAVALRGQALLSGDTAAARDLLRQALAIFQEIGNRSEEAITLRGLGKVEAALGNAGAAAGSLSQARAIQSALGQPGEEALTLREMARLERSADRLTEARGHLEEALARLESLRAVISGDHLRATYFAASRETYEMYVDVLQRLAGKSPSAGDALALGVLAFEAAERARARGLLDFLEQSRIDLREGDPALLQEERRLRREMNEKATRRSPTSDPELTALEAQYQIVEARLDAGSPHYARLRQSEVRLAEIQREALDADTVLLEYFLAEPRSYLWLVTPGSLATFELPGRSRIEELALRVHQGLSDPAPPDAARRRRDLAELSRLLLGPALGRARGKRLAIVADGALLYVPFAALPDPEGAGGAAPLIAGREVIHLPSAAVVRELRRAREGRPRAPAALAVLADPVFGADDPRLQDTEAAGISPGVSPGDSAGESARLSGAPFSRLGWTRQEAEAIAAEARGRDLLLALGFEADRGLAVGAALSRYRIVHFATHGVLDTQHPALSGLVLSQIDARGQARDGYLRLHDIYRLRLNADLVVLSGCETALGETLRGEGIVGLTRGFFHAGSSQVLASLWPVRDRATAELMRRFYHALFRERLGPSAALRQAQISLWKERAWHDPYFWAAFTLQGDWRVEAP
jgi:CHAT domain-containing protein/Tfp pilus assembly protein PilF